MPTSSCAEAESEPSVNTGVVVKTQLAAISLAQAVSNEQPTRQVRVPADRRPGPRAVGGKSPATFRPSNRIPERSDDDLDEGCPSGAAAREQQVEAETTTTQFDQSDAEEPSPIGHNHGEVNAFIAVVGGGGNGTPVGLTLDALDPKRLFVNAVSAFGSVATYNSLAPEARQLRVGDFICGVNGCDGAAELMLTELRHAPKLCLKVDRGSDHQVQLGCKGGFQVQDLSCVYDPTGSTVVVRRVVAGRGGATFLGHVTGVSKSLKSSHADSKPADGGCLQAWDRIAEVDGISGNAGDIRKRLAISGGGVVTLRVRRPAAVDEPHTEWATAADDPGRLELDLSPPLASAGALSSSGGSC